MTMCKKDKAYYASEWMRGDTHVEVMFRTASLREQVWTECAQRPPLGRTFVDGISLPSPLPLSFMMSSVVRNENSTLRDSENTIMYMLGVR